MSENLNLEQKVAQSIAYRGIGGSVFGGGADVDEDNAESIANELAEHLESGSENEIHAQALIELDGLCCVDNDDVLYVATDEEIEEIAEEIINVVREHRAS